MDPANCGGRCNDSFWCERINDFLEARIAPQRIPVRMKLQVGRKSETRDSAVAISRLLRTRDLCRLPTRHVIAKYSIMWAPLIESFVDRQQLDGASAFAQCIFFSAKSGID